MNIDIEQAVSAVKPIKPYQWESHGLTVVQDGYLDNGTRVHVVREKLKDEPVILSNAVVISENFHSLYQVDPKAVLGNVAFKFQLKQD